MKIKLPFVFATVVLFTASCQLTEPYRADLIAARDAQVGGQSSEAYRLARPLVNAGVLTDLERAEAAFIAGLALRETGTTVAERREAAELLNHASTHPEQRIADQARLELGLVQSELQNWERAYGVLSDVAPRLQGDDQATAWFYSGAALAKLDRVDEARTCFRLAERHAVSEDLRTLSRQYHAVTGYTIQVGAVSSREAADRLVDEWRDRATSAGYAIRVDQRTEDGRDLFRVYIGSFGTWQAAADACSDIGTQTSEVNIRATRPD